MPGAAATFCERRFLVQVSGTNFSVFDSGTNVTTSTALAAAGSQTLPLFNMEVGGNIIAARCKPTLAFTGGAVTAASVEVGFANATDCHLARFDIFSAVADTQARSKLQVGATLKGQVCAPINGAGAVTIVGAAGDGVVGIIAVAPAAGYTAAGSEQAANVTPLTPGVDFESVISTANQLQQKNTNDLTAFSGLLFTTSLQGEGLNTATLAINALFRTTGANVSALTAGSLEIALCIWDAPILSAGVG